MCPRVGPRAAPMLSVLAAAFATFGTVLVATLVAVAWPRRGRQPRWSFRAPFLVPETHAWSRFHARCWVVTRS